jgi:hypothetical protein
MSFLDQPVGRLEIAVSAALALVGFKIVSHIALIPHSPENGHLLVSFLAQNNFLIFGLIGAFLVQAWTLPSRLQYYSVIALGFASCLFFLLRGAPLSAQMCASFLGIASLAVLFFNACVHRGGVRRSYFRDFGAASVVPICAYLTHPALYLTYVVKMRSCDILLYRFDQTLGFQPSILMARFFISWPIFQYISRIVYVGLPAIICVLYAVQRSEKNVFRVNLLKELGIATVAGFLLYVVIPAAGPIFLLGANFPMHPPSPLGINPHQLAVKDAYFNAMPSLHMTWVILLWWNTSSSRFWIRCLTGFTLAFTVCATLGFGEHYLIDLAVAFPFALTVQAVCLPDVNALQRCRAAGIGVAMLVVSFFLLKFGVPLFESHTGLSWTFVVAIVVASSLMAAQVLKESVEQGAAKQSHL